MEVTKQQLAAIMPNSKKIDLYLPYINKFLDEFQINTPKRLQHYLAQIAHESGELNRCEENLNYSASRLLQVFPKYFKTQTDANAYAYRPVKIGSRVYGGRMGNGAEATQEGYTFRGRGLIQITGKDNYRSYSGYCGVDLTKQPELLARPYGAVRSSMWIFKTFGCNALADKDDLRSIRKKINGGYNGLADTENYLKRARQAIK